VTAFKLREIADFGSPLATASNAVPIGSATAAWRRVATPGQHPLDRQLGQ
jgi:hypothetical protein